MANTRDSAEIEKNFTDALPVIDDGMKCVKADQISFYVLLFLSITLLFFTSNIVMPYGLDVILKSLRVFLVLVAGFSLWSSTVMANKELNGFLAVRKDINNLLKSNPAFK
jgi:hypothetical protein